MTKGELKKTRQPEGDILSACETVLRILRRNRKNIKVYLWIGHGQVFQNRKDKHMKHMPEFLQPKCNDFNISINVKKDTCPTVLSTANEFMSQLSAASVDGILLCNPPISSFLSADSIRNFARVLKKNGYVSHRSWHKTKSDHKEFTREHFLTKCRSYLDDDLQTV